MYKKTGCLLAGLCMALLLCAQKTDSLNQALDSLYIKDFEKKKYAPVKLLHAEPLYIDLIRDLGARKGEKEWNFGFGLTDNLNYDAYDALVEYEWAPANRLGLEVELPFTFYYAIPGNGNGADSNRLQHPGSRLNSLKMAAQYTFLVSARAKTSLAIGYLHEWLMPPFREYTNQTLLNGYLLEPFLVAAKRWGNNFHTLLYTGPVLAYSKPQKTWHHGAQFNFSLHYMLPGTRNFLGIENNGEWHGGDFDLTIRPQMRLGIADNLLVGVVAGIPVKRENQRLSSFLRLIYEPAEHNRKKSVKHTMAKH